jgi:hypothetical protein
MLERAIGSVLVCASQNIGMLIEGHIVNGLVGIKSAQVSVYVAESAPPFKRGRFVGAQQGAICGESRLCSSESSPSFSTAKVAL